jgi:hypothetical protein
MMTRAQRRARRRRFAFLARYSHVKPRFLTWRTLELLYPRQRLTGEVGRIEGFTVVERGRIVTVGRRMVLLTPKQVMVIEGQCS